MMKAENIRMICFPNTVERDKQSSFHINTLIPGLSQSVFCDGIRKIKKNGEMEAIDWFQIIKDNKIVAEIKESVCDIYID